MKYEHSAMLSRIKKEKTKLKITNVDLAEMTGIPLGTLNKILSGDSRDPQISSVIKIAKALGMSADYIIFGENTHTENQQDREGIKMYLSLDSEDKAEIRGEMRHMLKASKYNNSETAEKQPERKPFSRHTVSSDNTSDNAKRKPFSGPRPARIAAYGHEVTGVDSSNNKK